MLPKEIKIKKTAKKTTLIIPAGVVLVSPVMLPTGEKNLEVIYGANSSAHLFWLDTGAQNFSGELKIVLAGDGAIGSLAGLVAGHGKKDWHLVLTMTQKAKKTFFQTVWRGLASGEAKFNWRGKAVVEKIATGGSTFLRGDFLLLSDSASVLARPSLEIGQPKVNNASHAVTVSPLDDAQLNYLFSRGLPKSAAEQILIDAFWRGLPEVFKQENTRQIYREVMAKIKQVY